MIAFGSIRLRYLTPKSAQREDHKAQPLHQQALQAYQKALREISFQQVVDHEDLGILLACIMLINCTECFLKRVPYDAVHTMSGLRIIRDCTIRPSERQNGTGRSLLDTLVPLFRRAGAAGMAFADDFSDDEFRWQCQGFDLEVPLVFSDVYSLDDRFNAVLKAILISTTDSLCDAQILESVKSALKRLSAALEASSSSESRLGTTELDLALRFYKIHQRTLWVMFHTFQSFTESVYDDFLEDFRHILQECKLLLREESPPDSPAKKALGLRLGFIPPLFLVATRCRHSTLRLDALHTLHECRRREHAWSSCMAFMTARFVIQYEESELSRESPSPSDASENRRIRLIGMQSHPSQEKTTLLYVQAPSYSTSSPLHTTIPFREAPHGALSDSTLQMHSKVLRACGYDGVQSMDMTVECTCD